MSNIDLNKIKINSWHSFLNKNDSNNALMDSITINILNIATDLDEIEKLATTVDENIEFTKSNSEIKQDRVNIIDRVRTFKNYAQKMTEDFGSKAYKIFSTQQYAETAIDAYDKGQTVNSDVNKTFLNIYNGKEDLNDLISAAKIMQFTSPIVGSLLIKKIGSSSFINNIPTTYAATKGFSQMTKKGISILSSRINQSLEGSFTIVDGKKIIKCETGLLSFWKDEGDPAKLKTKLYQYFNGTTDEYVYGDVTIHGGTIFLSSAVAGLLTIGEKHLYYKVLNPDEGDYTDADLTYESIDTWGHTGVAVISGFLACGGPAGVIASLVNTYVGGKIIDSIATKASGETIVDKWTTDGQEYVMHENGIGRENTSDVFFERIDKTFDHDYDLGEISCATYQQREYVLYEHPSEIIKNGSISKDNWEILETKIKDCGSADNAKAIFDEYCDYPNTMTADGLDGPVSTGDSALGATLKNLETKYGFDPKKWYEYMQNKKEGGNN